MIIRPGTVVFSPEEQVRVANAIVDDLFKNNARQRAERLVLESKDKRDLGGWGRSSVRDRILDILRKSNG